MNARQLIVWSVGVVAAWAVSAQVPQQIAYQGRLANGTNLVNGTVGLSLRLFNVPAGGTSVYEDSNSVTVADGLYSTFLGDNTTSGSLAAALTNASVWIETAVEGVALSPRERVASVAYALVADGVRPGGVNAEMLAPGASASNLQAGGQSAVPVGGIVLSYAGVDTNLIANGYSPLGTMLRAEDGWIDIVATNPPTGRAAANMAWTGSEWLLWGGIDGLNPTNSGARYNPVTKTWTAMSTLGAPSARLQAVSVWTGTELLIWGGGGPALDPLYTDGARYNPSTDSWAPINPTGGPSARAHATAVWSGTEMIVWGGDSNGVALNTGARYNPSTDTWTPMTTSGAPAARHTHTAVWAGSQMIVWGGITNTGGAVATGARYVPSPEGWTALTTANAPTGRFGHVALWTGTGMFVWGGNRQGTLLNSGGFYALSPESWMPLPLANAPTPRMYPSAVWSGTNVYLWGGSTLTNLVGSGGVWSPQGWQSMATLGEPSPRYQHGLAWTGDTLLLFGGVTNIAVSPAASDLWTFTPGRALYLYQR